MRVPADSKIAYVVSMRAGLEAFIYRELDALYKRGLDITLFATRFNPDDVYSPKPGWKYHTATPTELLLSLPSILLTLLKRPGLLIDAVKDGGIVDLVIACRFARTMQRERINQVHCHFGDHKFFIGYYCKQIADLPLSVTIHAHEFYTNPNERLFRKALHAADRVFAIAQKWVDWLANEYDVSEAKLRLSRLFVDPEINRPSTSLHVLAVGRFTERKGFVYLMKSLRLLTDLDIKAIFVGFGEQDLRSMALTEGVADRVIVFDKMDQNQLSFIYQSCDVLCVPSVTTDREGAEGIPVVLMEGMACGMPVVTTSCGAITELVDEVIVREGSVEGLATSIRNFATDANLRAAHGRRNRNKILQEYSPANADRFCAELLSITKDGTKR